KRDEKKAITEPSDEELLGRLQGLDDANLLRAGVEAGWDGPGTEDLGFEASYLPNIVASCAMTSKFVFTDPSTFTKMADPLIKHGLDQLSPECRERLLDMRVKAVFAGGSDAITSAEGLKKISECAEKMPYREGPANLLLSPE